jgi:HK97 family phage portal protein
MPNDFLQVSPFAYYEAYNGLTLPKLGKYKQSSNRAMQVAALTYGIPQTLDQYIRLQLAQSRRKFFVFHEVYRRDTWVRAAIDYIVRRATRDSNRLVDEKDPLNPDITDLHDFMSEDCNPDLDFEDLYKGLLQDMLEFQQGYLFIERTFGDKVKALWPMDARITFPVTDFSGTILFHAQVYNGRVEVFMPDEVVYCPIRNNGSDPRGLPSIETLFDSVSMEHNANKYNAALFENNLNIGAIFSLPDATEDEIEQNKTYLEDQYATPENAHRPLLLRGNAKLLRDGALAIKDINFAELIALARHRVCAVFGVPESLLGIPDNTNRATGDIHERNTYVNTVRPLRRLLNRLITKQFIRKAWGSRSVKLDEPLNSMLPTQGEIEAVAKAAEVGLMYNDVLEMLGLPRVPNGDYFVMKIPGAGGYVRLDLTAMPGLGDPHFDFAAYQNEHQAQEAQAQDMAMQSAASGMPAPPPATSQFPYVPPRPQDQIQQEAIAARIVDLSRSLAFDAADEHDFLLEVWTPDVMVSRRIPMAPGSRGGSTLYFTSSGKARYGRPPRGKQPPADAKNGEPNRNSLTNPRDPNMPKRLTPEERLQMAAARSEVETLFRTAQAENWSNDEFFSQLQSNGWEPAADTRDQFHDARDARDEARRLSETYPENSYVILGADGQYFVMQKALADVGTPGEQRGVGEPSHRLAVEHRASGPVQRSMPPALDAWAARVRAFTGGTQ